MNTNMNNGMTAAYIGSYATGTIHQMFDTCYLHVCALTFEHVDCYKDESTFEYIKETGEKYGYLENVTLHKINIVKEKSKLTAILHALKSAYINISLFVRLKQDFIIYAYNNSFSLHLMNFLNRFYNKKIIICAHGELEMLVSNKGGLFAKVHRFLLRNFFFHHKIQKNISFVVLGDSIHKNICEVLDDHNSSHFYSMELPCYMDEKSIIGNKPKTNVQFGLLGTLTSLKGLDDFRTFVKGLKANYNEQYKVSIIGRLNTHDLDDFLQSNNIDVTWSYLSRSEFENRISTNDFILFFYPHTSYKLIASGTILDAIGMNKPILAIRNDFFEYIVKISNCPALLFESVEEMIEAIKNKSFLSLYDNSYIVNKHVFSPEYIATQLQSLIKKVYDNN